MLCPVSLASQQRMDTSQCETILQDDQSSEQLVECEPSMRLFCLQQ
jgi:hypothetical protein